VAPSSRREKAPAKRARSHFEIHEGTTVRVEDEEPGFRRVKLANGLTAGFRAVVELVVPGLAGRRWSRLTARR